MNKTLCKAVMTRARLRNRYIRNPTQTNETIYKRFRNYCVNLFKKEKKSTMKIWISNPLLTINYSGEP